MTQEIRRRHVDDTRTLISFVLKQDDEDGVSTPVDLTGLSAGAIKIKMFNAANGDEVIALTATGVTFSANSTGLVHYDFSGAGVMVAGYFNPFFVLTVGSETDTFPVKPGDLRIELDSDTETAEQAYCRALLLTGTT